MSEKQLRVGITHGDINGIGYEVIFKALEDNRIYESFVPIIYGSSKVAAYHRKVLNIPNFSLNSIKSVDEANEQRINIINCLEDEVRVELGKSTTEGGDSAFKALELAVADLKSGKLDVLITAPINKKNIQSEAFKFPGHTEYLEMQDGTGEALMLMVSDSLRVGVVVGHVALKDVPTQMTEDKILNKLRTLNNTLRQDFSIRRPRIAVLGLNPHAGDEGVLGNEEQTIIIPALNKAKTEGIMALGPFPADGLFGSENFKKFDAILAMYHDQGLAPFKALTFSRGVNYTAGLSFIRTSPDHGTAFDIAGQDKASFESFKQAIYLAIDVCKNRKMNKELMKNPLKSYDASELEQRD